MAQGAIKKAKPAAPSSRRHVAAPKKGARTIAPKRASLIKQQKVTKKLSASLTVRTERSLAEKAGHLEMLAGGKKDGKSAGDAKKGKKDKKNGP